MADHAKEKQIPLILCGVGLALYVVAALVHSGVAGVAPTIIGAIVGGMISAALLIAAAFIVAAVVRISFGDFNSAILKFAGASLAAGGLNALLPLGGIVGLVVVFGLIMWLFEIEVPYAVILAIVYWLLALAVAAVLVAVVRGMTQNP